MLPPVGRSVNRSVVLFSRVFLRNQKREFDSAKTVAAEPWISRSVDRASGRPADRSVGRSIGRSVGRSIRGCMIPTAPPTPTNSRRTNGYLLRTTVALPAIDEV